MDLTFQFHSVLNVCVCVRHTQKNLTSLGDREKLLDREQVLLPIKRVGGTREAE